MGAGVGCNNTVTIPLITAKKLPFLEVLEGLNADLAYSVPRVPAAF